MHDAATVTLIILTATLVWRSLLSSPDATPGIRVGEGGRVGDKTLVLAAVRARSPHSTRRHRARIEGF
jgi:hypothetical protein